MAKVFKIYDFIIFTSCFSFLATFQLVAFAISNILNHSNLCHSSFDFYDYIVGKDNDFYNYI
jgi:hypothetical protein